MAYAITSTRGQCRAMWAENVDKVVIDMDHMRLSVHLRVDEAWSLAAELIAAAHAAECSSPVVPVAA